MSEESVIQHTTKLHTRESLIKDFHQLGLRSGIHVIIHSSLSSIGYVSGGAVTVVQALMDVITTKGTIVMPTHTSDNSDPSLWENPPVPEEWWQMMRDTMPAFHPAYTPTRGMGKIVEVFRTFPDVRRSNHPALSFAAWGKHAKSVTTDHPFDNPMGEVSPLAKLYDLNSSIVLLGVGYDSNSSLHLAEYREKKQVINRESAAMEKNGEREWVTYQNIVYQTELFPQIGADYEENRGIMFGKVGNANVRLLSQVDLVDYAVEWLDNRTE